MQNSRWKKFLGGSDLLYTLLVLILIGVLIWIFNAINFVFYPLVLIISNIILPLLLTLMLYYVFNPLINFMERKGIKRGWGIAIVYILGFALLVGAGILVFPILRDQVISFINAFPSLVESLIESTLDFLSRFTDSVQLNQIIHEVENALTSLVRNTLNLFLNNFTNVSNAISNFTATLIAVLVVPIVLIFLLKDNDKFFNSLLKIVPPTWRRDTIELALKVNTQFGAYIQGTLLVALADGVIMYIIFKIIGLNFAGIIAILGGILAVIPYIGPTLTFIPAFIVAFTQGWPMVLALSISWIIIQGIQGINEAVIKGESVEVHPLVILTVLAVMGDLLGFYGLIFGIPFYLLIKVVVIHFFQKFKKRYNRIYGDLAGEFDVEKRKQWDFGDEHLMENKRNFIDELKAKNVDTQDVDTQ